VQEEMSHEEKESDDKTKKIIGPNPSK